MNQAILDLLCGGDILVTSPKMTSTSQNDVGGTWTISNSDSLVPALWNTDTEYYNPAHDNAFIYVTLVFPRPIIVKSLYVGTQKRGAYYCSYDGAFELYHNGTAVYSRSTNCRDYPNTTYTINDILATSARVQQGSSNWNQDGGGVGSFNGVSISGIMV